MAPLADPQALDAADELAPFRERFHFGEADARGRIYLDGNSLGRMPLDVARAIREHVDEWGERLVTGWPDWIDAPRQAGDALAPVIGAKPGEVIACDSVTVNLFKLAAATTGPIAASPGDFPTDRYVLTGLGREIRPLEQLEGAGLVVLSHVDYRSGELADMRAVTAAAHDAGALVLWDLSHSAGVLPIELDAAGADLAVGCTYKHLNAGPGAPAFLYVRHELADDLHNPIQGWFGQRDQFAMGPDYRPVDGVGRFLTGTPNVIDLAAIEAAVALVGEAGIAALRAKSAALTAHAIAAAESELSELGFELATPREADRRGGHVALRHPDAWRVCRALLEHEAVVPDFREPDILRLGMPPLTTTFADVAEAIVRTRRVVENGLQLGYDRERSRVT